MLSGHVQQPQVTMHVLSKPACLLSPPLRGRRLRTSAVAEQQGSPSVAAATPFQDQYCHLQDRLKAPPLPLPSIKAPVVVTIVRHGQSTWNAESRVQGSSDLSVLTEKGMLQAQATRDMLSSTQFSQLWCSPLARAFSTAQTVWNGRVGPQHCDPVLREIDLYSFQGLEKSEVKARFAQEYQRWHHHPEEFELDGHFPVHESWYRASLAWLKILTSEPSATSTLVVAHNNTNQALIAVALQLPVTFFRRLTQCNAAVSQIYFRPADQPGEPPEAVLMCLNQSVANPARPNSKVQARVVLLVATSDEGAQDACTQLVQAAPVRHVLLLPANAEGGAAQQPLATRLATQCRTAGGEEPDVITLMQEAGNDAWQFVVRAAGDDGGCTVVVVLDSQSAAGLTCSAFGLGQMARHKFNFDAGGVSVFDFGGPPSQCQVVTRCLNSRSHLMMRNSAPAGAAADALQAGAEEGS